MQVIYMHSLYHKIGGYITKELYYHMTNMIITVNTCKMFSWLYQKIMQYTCNICHYIIKDIYYLDSIALWSVNTTPKGMYVHDLECTFSLSVG